MKQIVLLALVLTTLLFKVVAQPNGGFENWSPEFTYETPDDWQTMNILSLTSPPNPLSAFKAIGLDKHSGNYALKIKSIFVNHNVSPAYIPDTLGTIFKGVITISPTTFKTGFPYTGRPSKLQFYSKYAPVGNDIGYAYVVLKRKVGSSIDTVAKGIVLIPATPVYTKFELNIDYFNDAIPDSAIIAFFSSYDSTTSRVGSTLFVDDVLFTGWVGINEAAGAGAKVQVFPNPAKEEINIRVLEKDVNSVDVFNISGKHIGKYKIQHNTLKINTLEFAEGTYFYELRNSKERVVNVGKFNVVK